MRLYRRGKKGTWWVQRHGVRESLDTTDRKAAELEAARRERLRVDPTFAAAHSATVESACAEFLRAAPTLGNRAKPPALATIEMWTQHVKHFVRVFGGATTLAEMDAAVVERYIQQRRHEAVPAKYVPLRPVSAATVDKELSTLRKVLGAAARRGEFHLELSRVLPERAPTANAPLNRALTWEQLPRLLEALEPREDRIAIVCFLVGLGADWCAVARAKLEDFERDSVLVRGSKTPKRFARVPVIELARPYVERARRWLVTEERFGPWLKVVRDLGRICAEAELPRVTPRDFRRTLGKELRARGVAPHLIGGMLRHSDGRMAEVVYAQLEHDALGALVRAAAE